MCDPFFRSVIHSFTVSFSPDRQPTLFARTSSPLSLGHNVRLKYPMPAVSLSPIVNCAESFETCPPREIHALDPIPFPGSHATGPRKNEARGDGKVK